MKNKLLWIIKKTAVLSLALAVIFANTACGKNSGQNEGVSAGGQAVQEQSGDEPDTGETEQTETAFLEEQESGTDGETETDVLEPEVDKEQEEIQLKESATEKLDKIVEKYDDLVNNEQDKGFIVTTIDNMEHNTAYYNFEIGEYDIFMSNGKQPEDMYVGTTAICNGFYQLANGNGWVDPVEYAKKFSEQEVTEQWGITDENMESLKITMSGVLKYVATLSQNSYELGDRIEDISYKTADEKVSAYKYPILMSEDGENMQNKGFVAVFDAENNLLNILYEGEGSDVDAMSYTISKGDRMTRQ